MPNEPDIDGQVEFVANVVRDYLEMGAGIVTEFQEGRPNVPLAEPRIVDGKAITSEPGRWAWINIKIDMGG